MGKISLLQGYFRYKALIKNIGAISILRIILLISPLVTYPYLIRVFGAKDYGIVLYALSVVLFLRVFVKFGFDVWGVKLVAENSEDEYELTSTVWTVVIIQVCIFFIGSIFLFLVGKLISISEENKTILVCTLLYPLADILMLEWFYQGLQKVKILVYSQALSALLGVVLIFIFIDKNSNLVFVPLIQGGSTFMGSLYAFAYGVTIVNKKISFDSLQFKKIFLESFPFFFGRLSGTIYGRANSLLIGTFAGTVVLAYYDLAMKIINLLKIPNSILDTALFPYISKNKNLKFAKKILILRVGIALSLIIILMLFSKLIVYLIGGEEMLPSLPILYIQSILLLLYAITHFVGSSLLVAFGYYRVFNLSVYLCFAVYSISVSLLYFMSFIGLYSILFVTLGVEILVMLLRVFYCRKYELL